MPPLLDLLYENMAHNSTNLLPEERRRSLRQLYFLRLAVVAVSVLIGVVVVHGILLLPSYLYLHTQVDEREAALATLTSSLAGGEEKEIGIRVARLEEDAAYLARLATTPKASAAVAAIIAVPRPGVRLTGFSFAPKDGAEPQMSVTGIAQTREALRRFEQVIGNEPYVTSTDLPISAYAKERDISFTILITGPFMP